jgi:hypothetical protein
MIDNGLAELTAAQLDQVAGGGSKPGVGTAGTNLYGGAAGGVIGYAAGLTPDGGKGGISGPLN